MAFTTAFSAVPRVTLGIECGAGLPILGVIEVLNTTSMVVQVWETTSPLATTTGFVHYVAVKQ